MQERLRDLISRHCETLRGNVAEVARCIRPADGTTSDPDSIERAIGITHQIKGSGGSIGFPDISAAAAELERHLTLLDAAGGRLAPELMAGLEDALAKIERLADGLVPRDSALFNVDIDRLGSGKTRRSA